MPRDISSTIKAVVDAQYGAETHDVVDITLPASGLLPAITMHCSGKTGLVVDGNVYQNILRSLGTIKYSLGGNADATSMTIENVSQNFGVLLTDTERILDGASIVIKRAFLVDPSTNTYESDVLFNGIVDGVKIDEEVVSLSVVSDMSQRGARIGNLQITQKCRWTFNKNASGIGPNCNWQLAQGGDPLDCDLVFDSPDGCLGHNNQHRFGGVPTLLAKELPPQVYPEGVDPSGWVPTPTRFPPRLDPDFQPWREHMIE